MARVLSRRVSRRVSDRLVATLDEEGLILRRPHGRREVLVTWEELESEYLHDARTGADAFRRPLPARWLPKPGEWIWVKPTHSVRGAQVRCVLAGLGEEIIVCRFGGRGKEIQVLLSRTRPRPSGSLKRVVTPVGEI